jgi:hypothetical protein
MDLLNSKISLILPELMARNTKLGERLKNKLKVSTLFNNIEHRNKKYLKGFIFSSNKRAKDLKTGLDINKAIKQNNKQLELLYNQMKDDLILKNSDILLKEKKKLNENTEQETHLKINDCIHSLKNVIKPSMSLNNSSSKTLIKSMSETELENAKNIISNNIIKEEKDIQDKINEYISKMRNSFGNINYESERIKIKKDFNQYIENMYIDNNIKLINYTKPNPPKIKDKENANLLRIKKNLNPTNYYIKKSRNPQQNSNIYLKRNISMNNINNHSKDNCIKENNTFENKLYNVEVSGKDTMEVLNSLAGQGVFLSDRLEQKIKKINSLIDLNLPYPSNYDKILNNMNKNKQKNDDDNSNKIPFYDQKYLNNKKIKKIKITPYMRTIILSLKEEIKNKENEFQKNGSEASLLPHLNFEKFAHNYEKNKKIKKITNVNNDSISYNNLNEKLFLTSKIL